MTNEVSGIFARELAKHVEKTCRQVTSPRASPDNLSIGFSVLAATCSPRPQWNLRGRSSKQPGVYAAAESTLSPLPRRSRAAASPPPPRRRRLAAARGLGMFSRLGWLWERELGN